MYIKLYKRHDYATKNDITNLQYHNMFVYRKGLHVKIYTRPCNTFFTESSKAARVCDKMQYLLHNFRKFYRNTMAK
jgi:hypothetical protein